MAEDSDAEVDEEAVFLDETVEPDDEEPSREIQLVEDQAGFWTLVDSERGAVGDAPSKAAGLALMEQYLEDMGVEIPDVEPAVPSEPPNRDPKLPPEPSMPDDGTTSDDGG
ncbi:MAG: hypothetical protein ACOCSD_04470 [Halolamina sp.]